MYVNFAIGYVYVALCMHACICVCVCVPVIMDYHGIHCKVEHVLKMRIVTVISFLSF